MAAVSWQEITRQPLARSLAVSLALHLALLAVLQPLPAYVGQEAVVIRARLQTPRAPERESVPEEEVVAVAPPLPIPPKPTSLPEPAPTTLASERPAPVKVPEPAVQPPPPPQAAPPAPAQPALAGPAAPAAPPTLALPSPIDTTWYQAREVDRHPKAIGTIHPEYPLAARQRGQEGTLKLMVRIDDLGRVQDVEVVESSAPGVFDEAAIKAFRSGRFEPAIKDGRPVRYQAYMRVVFELD
ncbi:MAG: TonB family protein [Pseudomonadota bacterium]